MEADHYLAVSGAAATIASDALMNPFDGWYLASDHIHLLTCN